MQLANPVTDLLCTLTAARKGTLRLAVTLLVPHRILGVLA